MEEGRREFRSLWVLIALLAGIGALVMATSGCSSRAAAGSDWHFKESVEGNVKTVRTLSGSVWGGTARLVEEASIGRTDGPDEYLLGQVGSVYAHDGRISIVDTQAPAVRVYDLNGNHLQDIGGEGGGPGEFSRPRSLCISPVDGTVYVRDGRSGRINLYEPDGNPREMWPIRSGVSTSRQMVVNTRGDIYTSVWANTDADFSEWRIGMARMGPVGATEDTVLAPDYEFEEWELRAVFEDGEGIEITNVPFAPTAQWVMAPDGSMIGGVSDRYRIEIRFPDGSTTVVERDYTAVPVERKEADWYERYTIADMREIQPGWAWNGKGIPGHKPAFGRIIADRSNRIWVRRQGPGIRLEGCIENPKDRVEFLTNPCWRDSYIMDVFDLNGRFLGEVDAPDGINERIQPFIEGDMFIAVLEDDEGAPVVKRYRLVLPGEEGGLQ
jgi:hypothetical protein